MAWADRATDPVELHALFWASRELRDGRIYEAVYTLAADPAAPALARIAALGALAAYVDPHLALDLNRLEPIEGWREIEWGSVWSIWSDPYQKNGEVPLPAGAAEAIGELIRELAASDPDPRVRDQAWWLARSLRSGGQDRPAAARARHRADCRLAARILTHGQPHVRRGWALDIIRSCGEAADVLPAVWTEPPTDPTEITTLYWASRRVRDGRIYEAVYTVAADPAAPTLARIAALGVLAAYADPHLALDLEGLEPIEGWPGIQWGNVWSIWSDPYQRDGAVPLPAGAAEAIGELIRELAESDPDPQVRDQAWWLPLGLRGGG